MKIAPVGMVLTAALTIGIGWISDVRLQAHHAFASEFDVDRPVRVKGKITLLELTNPHGWIHLDAVGTDGQVERWMFETATARALAREGVTKLTVKIGTEIVVEGFLAKGVPRRATAQTVTYPDGRKVFIGSSADGTYPKH